ncbi:tfiih polypeptide 4 [Anaeramoeba ignava]|uniref:General transcription factor IIH subunit 4 n=1 Tax=Anaeramoeba ignava TaxID=1746090 RepID=A0A9Q0LDY6_ANAIG|nr:tfiih polypeptide 4 [Anaeramoeba ignava]
MEGGIIQYLTSLNKENLNEIYSQPFTCKTILKILSPLSKQYVLQLLCFPQNEPVDLQSTFLSFIKPEMKENHQISLNKLVELNIFIQCYSKTSKNCYSLNPHFYQQLSQLIINYEEFVEEKEYENQNEIIEEVTEKQIKSKSKKQWEAILSYLIDHVEEEENKVESKSQKKGEETKTRKTRKKRKKEEENPKVKTEPKKNRRRRHEIKLSQGFISLLEKTGFLSKKIIKKKTRHKTTQEGFRFLFEDQHTQMWRILLFYIDNCEERGMVKSEVISFLLRLSFMKFGRKYNSETLSLTQQTFLLDLDEIGLVYLTKNSQIYYPSHITSVLSNTAPKYSGNGHLIIETNFRIYAKSPNQIQLQLFTWFVHSQHALPNLASGVLTKRSIRSVLIKGLTGELLLKYIEHNTHPEMLCKFPVIPPTVTEQILLWEKERNRLSFKPCRKYFEFPSHDEYFVVKKFAEDSNFLIWSSDHDKIIITLESAHKQIEKFISSLSEKRK